MKKSILLFLTLGLMTLIGCTSDKEVAKTEEKNIPNIGITQIVEHPSLDAIRDGIYTALEDKGYVPEDTIHITYLNSQGDMNTANTIASQFASEDYDLVVGITTPSAQALFNQVKDTPIIYSAVTDPISAGLEGDLITGVSDMTPVKEQLELLKELLPETQTIGMVYNTGELNSEVQVNMAKEAAKELGMDISVSSITNTNEVALAVEAVLRDADVLYVQKDNTLASAFPVIVQKANEKKVPIIGAVLDYVDQGALATDGPSEYQIGYKTGEMIVQVLEGTPVKDIPFKTVNDTTRHINEEVAKTFNISLN